MNNNVNNINPNTIVGEQALTLSDVEELRKKTMGKILKNSIIFITIAIIIYTFLYISFNTEFSTLFIFLFIALLLAYACSFNSLKQFKAAFKKYFAISIFKQRCENVYFDFNHGIGREVIAMTEMMRMGDIYTSNDYISGKYKGVNFEYSDVHIQDKYEDSEGRTHYTTLFKGQWFIFDFHKNFKSNLQICEKNFGNAKRNRWFGTDKYRKVSLEDIDFNKTFKVFAQNDLEAFYILTPHTMEGIKTINNNMPGSLLFCFVDNQLHVGLHNNKDSFEASVFKRINESEIQKKVSLEVDNILNFIDILNLDNTLFK